MLGVKFRRGFRRSLIPGAEPAASPQGWDGFFGFFQGVFPWEKKKKKRLLIPVLIPSGIHPRREPPKWGENRKKRGKKKSRGEKKYKKSLFPTARARASSSCKHSQTSCWKTRQAAWGFYGIGAFLGFFFFSLFCRGILSRQPRPSCFSWNNWIHVWMEGWMWGCGSGAGCWKNPGS